MIVIVTNRQDYTADFLIIELQRRGADYVRFNTEDYPQHVQISWRISSNGLCGEINFPKQEVKFEDIKSVWYRRPMSPVPSSEITDTAGYEFAKSESQIAIDGLWRTLDCFWVSHPDNLRSAEHKLRQLKVAHAIGLSIESTIATNNPDDAMEFYAKHEGQIVFKPIKHGRILREDTVSLIYTNVVKPNDISLFKQVAYAPTLFQKYVPKKIEIRVTVIGKKAFAVEIHSQSNDLSIHDWRRGDTAKLHHQLHHLPTNVEKMCLDLVQSLGLEFGAIDLILTPNDEYVFLEINPNGQWAWIQQLCPEIPLRETLADLLIAPPR